MVGLSDFVFVCSVSFGPYLPCRENIKLMGAKNNIRPPRPELNMCLLPSMVESGKVRSPATHLSRSNSSFRIKLHKINESNVSVCENNRCVSVCVSQGKDEVYDRMLLDYFLSYHQFIHLLCRVAINCEKFTDTLVKLST